MKRSRCTTRLTKSVLLPVRSKPTSGANRLDRPHESITKPGAHDEGPGDSIWNIGPAHRACALRNGFGLGRSTRMKCHVRSWIAIVVVTSVCGLAQAEPSDMLI